MPKFFFTTTDDYPIGDTDAPNVRAVAMRAEAAHYQNMDAFVHPFSNSEIVRAHDEHGKIVGWMNTFTGKFTSR